MSITSLRADQIITLVTDHGLTMIAKRTDEYVETSAYYHIQGRSHHPKTTGVVERLIRTVKEEEIYVNDYLDPSDAQRKLNERRYTYNRERPH